MADRDHKIRRQTWVWLGSRFREETFQVPRAVSTLAGRLTDVFAESDQQTKRNRPQETEQIHDVTAIDLLKTPSKEEQEEQQQNAKRQVGSSRE